MSNIEVLLVYGLKGRVAEVFLRDGDTIIHEPVGDFIYRCVSPHTQRFEMRQMTRDSENIPEPLWYLMTIPHKNSRTFHTYTDAFEELFMAAGGFYQESPIIPLAVARDVTEQIVKAAIVFEVYHDTIEQLVPVVITAKRHADCFEVASKEYEFTYAKDKCEQGFWTSKNRFVDRYEAKAIALENGQLKEDTGMAELYSEDLW